MASAGVNVLRWSALGVGVLYGAYHQRTLRQQQRAGEQQRAYAREESLIVRAKAEYVQKTLPLEKKAGNRVISNPDDPNFDLEAYLTMKAADTAK